MNKKRLIVVGGGAAGFFCAINAARSTPALEVMIIEKTGKTLGKVKVSGGGRCNVTHSCFSISEMIKRYPRGANFLKKIFHHFFTNDTIAWFKERGIELKTEDDGRMFPITDSSQTIIDCLRNEAEQYKVEIRMRTEVKAVRHDGTNFQIELSDFDHLTSDFICIASGGYATLLQFDWLRKMGHTIIPPVPSLFTFNIPGNNITELMGISVENVLVKITGTKLTESGPLLITHWGLSGPAILKLSAWGARELEAMKYHFNIIVNWLPAYNEQTLKEKFQQIRFGIASQKIINRNPFILPQRLWQYFLQQSGVDENIRWADLPSKEQKKLIKNLCAQEFQISGKTTFKEEFVTAGGISLQEVDPNTMQSKILPGLFFAGEVLDIDGITGGFNFQNAWTTAFIAAKSIAENSS